MAEFQKITVQVPTDHLKAAQELTGHGVTETVREGLRLLASRRAQQRLMALRGKVTFSLSLEELRGTDE